MTDNDLQHAPLADAMRKGEFLPKLEDLRSRASKGDNVALIALGHIYFKGGNGVPKDYVESLHWFERVDREYDPTGFVASHIAIIYYRGLGVEKNYQKASKYLRRAALRGRVKSKILFAHLQKNGKGKLKKPVSAKKILQSSMCDKKLGVVTRLLAFFWLYF